MSTQRGKDLRKRKRFLHHMHKKCGTGKYVVDCRYHPCIVIQEPDTIGDMTVSSLLHEVPFNSNCSIFHCGIKPISKSEALARVEFIKNHNFFDHLLKFESFTEEGLAHFKELHSTWGLILVRKNDRR